MYDERKEQRRIYRRVFILFVWKKKLFLFFKTNKSLEEKILLNDYSDLSDRSTADSKDAHRGWRLAVAGMVFERMFWIRTIGTNPILRVLHLW
jgi:hypothetical protein